MAASLSGVERVAPLVQLAGSSTLGCYISHFYVLLLLNSVYPKYFEPIAVPPGGGGDGEVSFSFLSWGSFILQLLLLLAAPLAYQLTVGAWFDKALVASVRALLAWAPRAGQGCDRACSRACAWPSWAVSTAGTNQVTMM